jgi:hypothetical protein
MVLMCCRGAGTKQSLGLDRIDMIIASDCVYLENLFDLFLSTLKVAHACTLYSRVLGVMAD